MGRPKFFGLGGDTLRDENDHGARAFLRAAGDREKSLLKRVAKLERSLEKARRKIMTLYNRKYARLQRRDRAKARSVNTVLSSIHRWKKLHRRQEYMLQRAALILAKRPVGRVTVYLTVAEKNKLMYWIKQPLRYRLGGREHCG